MLYDLSYYNISYIQKFAKLSCFSGDRDRHILVWEPGGEGGGQPDNANAIRDAWSSDDEDS